MSIDNKQFKFEETKLEDTETRLKCEIGILEKNNQKLIEKIGELKKQAKGRYNEELETTQKLYNISNKNFKQYNESIDQPYFGRIDFREYKRLKETYYIGKFGLWDSSTGDELVIDWRAPIADLYYSGTQGKSYYKAPQGWIEGNLSLKRKFIIRDGKLNDAFDEGINEIILKNDSEKGGENALVDEFLRISLEENLSGKLKDVVATIQKEQNDIIRASKNGAIVIQGSAGSGKTTIVLHRLAYLLYKYKESLSGEEILVIAPNKLFLDYISDVLPGLGAEKVKQKTFEEISTEILGIKGKILTKDKKLSMIMEKNDDNCKLIMNSSKFKGSMLFKSILDKYIAYIEKKDTDIDDIKVEKYVLFKSDEIIKLYMTDMRDLPINKRKDEIKRYLSLKLDDRITSVLDKIDFTYEYMITRVKRCMEDCPERRKKLIKMYDERDAKKKQIRKEAIKNFDNYFILWKDIDLSNLYYEFFNNEQFWNEMRNKKVHEDLRKYCLSEMSNNRENGIIDSDDLAAMIYLKFKTEDISEKYKFKYIAVDEAQDYSLFQLYVIKMMAVNSSLTIVGDVGQEIFYYKGIDNWDKVKKDVFNNDMSYFELSQSYRSTVEIIKFAYRVLKKQKCFLKPALPVLRHGAEPQVISYNTGKEFSEKLDEIVESVQKRGKTHIAVIGKNYEECKKIKETLRRHSKFKWETIKDTDKSFDKEKVIIPSYMTKGLEFDCTVIYNCNNVNYSDTELDKKILYVVLTRALHEEYVFYRGEMSPLIKS